VLTDGNIAFGSEPWRIPDPDAIPAIDPGFRRDPEGFQPFARDEDTLARPWAIPGTAGLEHRIGGLEKEHGSGNISYDPDNHELMSKLRADKIQRIADDYAPTRVDGDASGKLVVVSWGSPYGPVRTAVKRLRTAGTAVSHLHLRNLWPLPNDLGEVLSRFERVLVPENNTGQLSTLLRAKYLIDVKGFNQVRGLPFKVSDLEAAILATLAD